MTDPAMRVSRLDHLVLTVRSLEAACEFYARGLGMRVVTFEGGRRALAFGQQKINLHEAASPFEPKAARPTPGSADLCVLTDVPLRRVQEHLAACGIAIVEGPVRRAGAVGPLDSLYIRDPDGNLIEVSNALPA
jgi:catechol 2,3-dioxygenase-like lactoylglutathione lyase family enzyme